MGRDYRIGLVLGLVLAGVALVWMATRPSLRPQLPTVQDSNRNIVAADKTGFTPPTMPTPQKNGSGGRKTQEESASRSTPRLPPSGIQTPAASSSTPPVRKESEPVKAPRVHVVRSGETLSGIAQQYYGSKEDWRKILAANGKTLKDANKLALGMELIIP